MLDVTTDWFWEGNVVSALSIGSSSKGWKIERRADTHSKERGVDLEATRGSETLLIEAKGYPSKSYRDPRRSGELKPTNPTNQAQHWYSHALLKALRLQTLHSHAKIAIAFPDFPRYQALFRETKLGLEKLGIGVLFVSETGRICEWGID